MARPPFAQPRLAPMPKPRKWEKGEQCTSFLVLIDHLIYCPETYIFIQDKAYHPAFLMGWSIGQLRRQATWGQVYIGRIRQEWLDQNAITKLKEMEQASDGKTDNC